MGCFDECLGNMIEPYGGSMPLFSGDTTDATVTIVQESCDDGMKVTRIQTPPRTPTTKLVDAINNVLGLMGDFSMFGDTQKNHNIPSEGGEKEDDIQSEPKSENSEDSDDEFEFGKQRGFGQKGSSSRVHDKD